MCDILYSSDAAEIRLTEGTSRYLECSRLVQDMIMNGISTYMTPVARSSHLEPRFWRESKFKFVELCKYESRI